MKIFQIKDDGEQHWVAANYNIEALQIWFGIDGTDLSDMSVDAEISELPEKEWSKKFIKYEDDENDDLSITFDKWMKTHEIPDVIASTIWDGI